VSTYDALGRVTGTGQALAAAFVQLPGQSLAYYAGSSLSAIRHADWLGSTRFSTAANGTYLGSIALAPFGEEYASGGSPQVNFTNQRRLLAGDLWDFPAREMHPTQGRWISPDPAGLAAVDITDPQTWNRYAYVRNTPTGLTDPDGLCIIDGVEYDEPCFSTTGTAGGAPPWLTDDPGWLCKWFQGLCSSGGGGGSTGGGGGGGGGKPPGLPQKIKKTVCSTLPQGRTLGASGGVGGIGGQTGGLELVANYTSGQVSLFEFGGLQAGWNGIVQGSVYSGFISGPLTADNSGYKGGFTAVATSVPTPVPGVSGVGFISGAGNGVGVVGAGAGVSLVGRYGVTVSQTGYTPPQQLGKYWAFLADPLDQLLFLAQQVCQ
jgi:RHS repeat-associated protein